MQVRNNKHDDKLAHFQRFQQFRILYALLCSNIGLVLQTIFYSAALKFSKLFMFLISGNTVLLLGKSIE